MVFKIHELKFSQFEKVKTIFSETLHLKFTIDAIIAGNSPGRIWVDDLIFPTASFVWDGYHCYYFGGTTKKVEFNSNIKDLLKTYIIPDVIKRKRDFFNIEYSNKDWEPIIKTMLKEKLPKKRRRVFLALEESKTFDWLVNLPTKFEVRLITKDLLESPIGNVESIINEVTQCWNSLEDFLSNGFGFCIVRGNANKETIQGWCTGEYFSEDKCGIGIETFREFQSKGLATAMASAFIKYCQKIGIKPHWNADKNNFPSLRVAEKIGFKKIQEYNVLCGSFSNVEFYQGIYHYNERKYQKAAIWFEKAAMLNQEKLRNIYNAACSWSLAGNLKAAFTNLNKVLDFFELLTPQFINQIKSDSDLANLRDTSDWKRILKRLYEIEKRLLT